MSGVEARHGPPITLVVTCSPVPSHPSTALLEKTLESVKTYLHGNIVETILAHDALRINAARRVQEAYQGYLRVLPQVIPDAKILVAQRWGHTAGLLRMLESQLETDVLLVVQHDMPFVRQIDIGMLGELLQTNPQVRHVRFNLRKNDAKGWDATGHNLLGFRSDRENFFCEVSFNTSGGPVSLMKTLSWSENNYITTADYLRGVILPVVGSSRASAETYLNAVSSRTRHNVLGTYVFGGWHHLPVVSHTDGRTYGQHASEEAPGKGMVPARPHPYRLRFDGRRPPFWLLSGFHDRFLARLRWARVLRRVGKRVRT